MNQGSVVLYLYLVQQIPAGRRKGFFVLFCFETLFSANKTCVSSFEQQTSPTVPLR